MLSSANKKKMIYYQTIITEIAVVNFNKEGPALGINRIWIWMKMHCYQITIIQNPFHLNQI